MVTLAFAYKLPCVLKGYLVSVAEKRLAIVAFRSAKVGGLSATLQSERRQKLSATKTTYPPDFAQYSSY